MTIVHGAPVGYVVIFVHRLGLFECVGGTIFDEPPREAPLAQGAEDALRQFLCAFEVPLSENATRCLALTTVGTTEYAYALNEVVRGLVIAICEIY
jgi:hypothetical protein